MRRPSFKNQKKKAPVSSILEVLCFTLEIDHEPSANTSRRKSQIRSGIRIRIRIRRPAKQTASSSGFPPTTIDLDEIGYWDDTVYPFDMEDEDSYSSGGEFEPGECLICGQIVTHGTSWCPYKEFVPQDASLPPGIQRVCRFCGKRDGHPGEDWEARAIPKRCTDCGTLGEHWTGDSDCPTKTGKPRCTEEEKPDSSQQTGQIFPFF